MALRWEMGWPNEIKGFDKRPHKLYKCQTCPAPVILQCFPWDLPYISLSEMSAGVDLSDWSREGAFWMNEEQKSKWEHNAKGTRKGLAGSPRAKPSACVLFLSEWQRGHFHGMSRGAWVYPAKPLLPQGLWAFMIPVSLLYTPCPVQPPPDLSLYPASHSHPALCLFSLILRSASLIKPRLCVPHSYWPDTPAIHNTEENERNEHTPYIHIWSHAASSL